jgi:hypothetical protein
MFSYILVVLDDEAVSKGKPFSGMYLGKIAY